MSVVRNGEKVQQWTERISRFRRGGQTVSAFCRSEGVSEASFYLWKRKLTPAADRKRSTSSGATSRERGSSRATSSGLAFQAVALTSLSLSPSATTVRLPRGIEIELGSDPRVIEAVVKQLLEYASVTETAAEGGQPC